MVSSPMMVKFRRMLRDKGLVWGSSVGCGNCMFSSFYEDVCHSLQTRRWGRDAGHRKVREIVSKVMQEAVKLKTVEDCMREIASPVYFSFKPKQYCSSMSIQGVQGDEIVAGFLSEIFNVRVEVHIPGRSKPFRFKPGKTQWADAVRGLVLDAEVKDLAQQLQGNTMHMGWVPRDGESDKGGAGAFCASLPGWRA